MNVGAAYGRRCDPYERVERADFRNWFLLERDLAWFDEDRCLHFSHLSPLNLADSSQRRNHFRAREAKPRMTILNAYYAKPPEEGVVTNLAACVYSARPPVRPAARRGHRESFWRARSPYRAS